MSGRSVLIVGAGFSGLAAAHHLVKAGFDVEIKEASERVGGLIKSTRTDEALYESAANGILNSTLVEDLFEAARVEMIPTSKLARARYIVRAGILRRWPLTLIESFHLAKAAGLYFIARHKLAPKAFESIADWGARVLSPSASRFTIETALQGIYAGDPTKLSATLILGRLFSGKSKSAAKLKFRGTVSAKNGMEELLLGLQRELTAKGVRFTFNTRVSMQELASETRPVIIATNAKRAAELISAVDAERAVAIAQVRLLPIISTVALFPKESFHKRGFGYLFSPGSSKVLGVLLNNWIFEERATNHVLSETWIMGGALAEPNLIEKSDQEILNLIVDQRAQISGARVHPLSYKLQRWPEALPHMTTELEQVAPLLKTHRKNIFLLGNYTGGIGLAKILEQAAELPRMIEAQGQWR